MIKTVMHTKSVTVFCCAFLLLIGSCSSTKDLASTETNTLYSFNPETRVVINAPAEANHTLPALLILYALPNGNTIEMTAGKKMEKGDDWHFDIQHVAAQTRFLRNSLSNYTVIVAYLETVQKSWPAWRQKYGYQDGAIARIVNDVRFETGNPTSVVLAGHSGGGSFITGFINAFDSIPDYITRIAYLDANYNYTDSLDHGRKLLRWLRSDPAHVLTVIAYDDREITLNGKKVVSSAGGTFRATQRMVQYFTEKTDVVSTRDSSIIQYSALDGRARFIVHTNPDTSILHTVLVERNGLIHSILRKTTREEQDYKFFGNRAYTNFIE